MLERGEENRKYQMTWFSAELRKSDSWSIGGLRWTPDGHFSPQSFNLILAWQVFFSSFFLFKSFTLPLTGLLFSISFQPNFILACPKLGARYLTKGCMETIIYPEQKKKSFFVQEVLLDGAQFQNNFRLNKGQFKIGVLQRIGDGADHLQSTLSRERISPAALL